MGKFSLQFTRLIFACALLISGLFQLCLAADVVKSEPVGSASTNVVLNPDADSPSATKSKKKSASSSKNLSGGSSVTVKRGDTLSGIAVRLKSEGVSLDRKLTGFYRGNDKAFISNNMNLLKAENELRVPEAEELALIPQAEAKLVVRKHAKVWKEETKKKAAEKEAAIAALNLSDTDQDKAFAAAAAKNNEAIEEDVVLRFEIRSYTLDGATLLSKQEADAIVAPYVGKNKDFSDVQFALEAVEEAYAKRGISVVHVLLPEQELEQGEIHFQVIESRFGKVTVKNSKFVKFVSDENALNALPSVRVGGIPRSKLIARELKLANENPSRLLNVVLKAGDNDDEVDATVMVTDSKPGMWSLSTDNTGSPETGGTRIGLSYRHANLFDKDHLGSLQMQVSPEHTDRVTVIGGGYKIPLYQWGDSAEFSAGYSNVNSVVGGFSNFQGGGVIFGARYNHIMDKLGKFDPRLTYGLDLRDFKAIEQTIAPSSVLYNEIMVMPVSLAYTAQGKLNNADVGFNVSAAANLPWLSKGRRDDFGSYDLIDPTKPYTYKYRVLRYGGNYAQPIFGDWQFRFAFNGQASIDALIQGEQMRLGGADGVRGFSEGSEGGEKGMRGNIEAYTPDFTHWSISTRALVFYDAGQATNFSGSDVLITSYGVGLRSSFANQISLRADAGRIIKAGTDPLQQAGDWRAHLALSASF